MSDFTAIVLDIDGTLLDSRSRLSERNWRALKACHEKGLLLYIATARPTRLVFRPGEVSHDVSFLTARAVFYNGARAVDVAPAFERRTQIPAETVDELAGALIAVTEDIQIVIQNDEYHSFRAPVSDEELVFWGYARNELIPFDEARRREVSKICAFRDARSLEPIYRAVSDRFPDRVCAFLTDALEWVQIVDRHATKERALLALPSLRDVPREKVVAFGNDANDIGMFRTFGCAVAVANAQDEVKREATLVTKSNDEDGVAFALEQVLKIV